MKRKHLYSLIIAAAAVFNVSAESFAQNKKIDSILTILKSDKEACPEPCIGDTNHVLHLILLCNEYRDIGSYNLGLKYGNEALNLASSIASPKGCASAYNNIGNIYYNQGNYNAALKNYISSLQINEELKNKRDIAGAFLNIGIIYYYQNNNSEALKNDFASLKIWEEIGDKKNTANSYNNIGLVYDNPDHYSEALKNYFIALNIYQEIGDKQNIAASFDNIGRIYNSQQNYPEALKIYFASLKVNQRIENKNGIAASFTNIGNVYWNQVHFPKADQIGKSPKKPNCIESASLLNKALKNYLSSLNTNLEINNTEGIVESYTYIGNVLIYLNKLKEAQQYLDKALHLSKEINSKEWIKESYRLMVDLDSVQGNWKSAYQHHKLYILFRDNINAENENEKTLQIAINTDFDKNEAAEIAEQDKINAVTLAENKKQKFIIGLIVIAFLLTVVFAGYIFRSRRLAKKIDYSSEPPKNKGL